MRVGVVGALLLLVGCHRSVASDTADFGPDAGGGFGGGNDAAGGVPAAPECADDTKDIFVISEQRGVYQFHPPTLTFKNLGLLDCPTSGATPTSMAVDRQGTAWVRHSDGLLWKVSTKTLACEPTSFSPPADGFAQFGMGFASETKGSSNEALYLSDTGGAGLGKLDLGTLAVRFIGPYTGALQGQRCELTGTGDGKLYGLFTTSPVQVAEISKGTGDVLTSKELPGVYAGDAWAFSFYGGDFYIYTHASPPPGGPPLADGGSDVTRYRPSDGSIEVVKPKLGFKIVGAGVSTCAPTSVVH